MSDQDDWKEYRRLVMDTLRGLKDRLDAFGVSHSEIEKIVAVMEDQKLNERVAAVEKLVTELKIKVALGSVFASSVITLGIGYIKG